MSLYFNDPQNSSYSTDTKSCQCFSRYSILLLKCFIYELLIITYWLYMLRYHIIHTYLLFFNGNHLFASLGSAKADLCCYVRLRRTTPHKNIYYNRLLNQIANKHQIHSFNWTSSQNDATTASKSSRGFGIDSTSLTPDLINFIKNDSYPISLVNYNLWSRYKSWLISQITVAQIHYHSVSKTERSLSRRSEGFSGWFVWYNSAKPEDVCKIKVCWN